MERLLELIKPSTILGYIRLFLYLASLVALRKQNLKRTVICTIVLFSWVIGELIDCIDGPISRFTHTNSSFGEKMDHHMFDNFREPFVWLTLSSLYPEFTIFWHCLLLRLFIDEDEQFQIPRVPILPLINVAGYFPLIIIVRYLDIDKHTVVKVIQVYLASVFITWGLKGNPEQEIRLDFLFQCHILRQADRCDNS